MDTILASRPSCPWLESQLWSFFGENFWCCCVNPLRASKRKWTVQSLIFDQTHPELASGTATKFDPRLIVKGILDIARSCYYCSIFKISADLTFQDEQFYFVVFFSFSRWRLDRRSRQTRAAFTFEKHSQAVSPLRHPSKVKQPHLHSLTEKSGHFFYCFQSNF